ncbi:hypothetical protein BGZ65_012214, partial [Modicella reniformis]
MNELIDLKQRQQRQQQQQQQQNQQKQYDVDHHHPPENTTANLDITEKAVENLRLSKANPKESCPEANCLGTSSSGKRATLQLNTPSTQDKVEEMNEAMTSRLQQIRTSVQKFLSQRFSVHEYTVPRLFITLPDDNYYHNSDAFHNHGCGEETKTTERSTNRYRLYLLCECGATFTLPLGSGLNHLHIAKHPGYEIDPGRQDEFFKRYGSMILMLLYFLKYGYDPAVEVFPISPQSVGQEQDGQQQQQQQQQQRYLDIWEAKLRKVEKISNLRRSDLPESIAQDVSDKFDRMIEYLEGLGVAHGGLANGVKESRQNQARDGEGEVHGLSSLSDLHSLYSFLGLADINKRLQYGQLGNLYRVSNVKGKVGWVCVYHYRWTFLERNIDEFERWVVTRRRFSLQHPAPAFTGALSVPLNVRETLVKDRQGGDTKATRIRTRYGSQFQGSWSVQSLYRLSSLEQLILPEFSVTDVHMQAIVSGIRNKTSLVTLDLSNSQLNDGGAIILAQGLFNTNICHLDLSKNEKLSDTSVARVIRAIGPRLTSLKMAQTGFGDLAAAALAKSMDGISITNTLRDQLHLHHRIDVAAIVAGHRPGVRITLDNPIFATPDNHRVEAREKTHSRGHLVYLDIEDNNCTVLGFKSLAKVKSRLQFVYLNLSGSKELKDKECARILERVASSEMITLRVAWTEFGDLSAKALAKALLEHPERTSGIAARISGPCQLEELDLQACPVGPEGLQALCKTLDDTQAFSCLRVLDLGHCRYLHDQVLQQLLKTLVIRNGTSWNPVPLIIKQSPSQHDVGSQLMMAHTSTTRKGHLQESSDSMDQEVDRDANNGEKSKSIPQSDSESQLQSNNMLEETEVDAGHGEPLVQSPPKTSLPLAVGFFTNLRRLDLKSTRIGDSTAWLLAQALVQTWTMINSLTILDPIAMSVRGICWILDALCENMTVQEVGIGKSNISQQSDLDAFGSGLATLLEVNRRIRSLTTLGAPLAPIAKGLLLNQSLHSIYLIRSTGQFEDLQLMGQALGFTRTLLVFWMGGSDDSLLGPLKFGANEHQTQETAETEAAAATTGAGVAEASIPITSTDSLQQQQFQRHQEYQEQQQHEN